MKSELRVSDIWADEAYGLTLSVAWGVDNPLYGEVLWLRGVDRQHDSLSTFEFDSYSFHYSLRHESVPIGCLSVTRHMDGAIDCQEFYPTCLFEAFGDRIASTCKFRILENSLPRLWTLRRMIRESWRYQQRGGMRMDMINADREYVRFYKWIGYRVIEETRFIHPHLGTDSVTLYMPTDPDHSSRMRDICLDIDDPIRHEDVQNVLARHRTYV